MVTRTWSSRRRRGAAVRDDAFDTIKDSRDDKNEKSNLLKKIKELDTAIKKDTEEGGSIRQHKTEAAPRPACGPRGAETSMSSRSEPVVLIEICEMRAGGF